MKYYDKLIFELSESGRCAFSLREAKVEVELPDNLKRQSPLPLPEPLRGHGGHPDPLP